MTFDQLGLCPELLQAIEKKGYTQPSPIQEQAIPVVLQQRDILASAQTGTGKTAAFTLPILQLLSAQKVHQPRQIRALILTPTRELAAQIGDNIRMYSEFIGLYYTVIFGGVGQNPQVNALRRGTDILVATPGRLLDLHNQKLLNLRQVEILVLDEADRMLDMGFLRDIKKILALLPTKRQNLLFSATYNNEIKTLANGLLHQPVKVEITPEITTAEKVNQTAYRAEKAQKTPLLIQLINNDNWEQTLVFTRTKHGANKLCEKLIKANITSAAIHGNKSQSARTKALADFKENKIRVLVATDIAARGLDIPLLPFVINFELPNIPEDYVHRIGRTGRAGASGDAISLVATDENAYLRDIEKLIGERIEIKSLEGFSLPQESTSKPTEENKLKPKPAKKWYGKKRRY